MTYSEICSAVKALQQKYKESDPFKLCEALGILVIPQSLGSSPTAIKGFFLEIHRIPTITVNSDLPPVIQKIIVAHELGHAVLHRPRGIYAFHEFGLFDESSAMEQEANLFAAEYLLDDREVLETLNADNTFFTAAASLYVPMELLDFKFRVMKWKGYQLTQSPIVARSNFMKNMEVPTHADDVC